MSKKDNDRLKGTIIRLFKSPYYIAAVTALAFVFFIAGLTRLGVIVSAVLFSAALILSDNERYAFPPLLTLVFQLSFRSSGSSDD